ncbi:MAG: TIGR01459 family HAD-type hydrolase [Alphaproteobacteria bacterium]|nr:TIGR01459 family HAD-type hydrolase [Alphaproteobacteria bacterium]
MKQNNTPRFITDLSELTNDFDTFFLDMYGVLWDGSNFYPNVLNMLKYLKDNKKKIYILTNMTALKPSFVSSKEKKGLIQGVHYDDVITSGDVCAAALRQGLFEQLAQKEAYSYYVLGGANPALFEDVSAHETKNIENADILYLSSVQTEAQEDNFDHFLPVLNRALERNLPAVCANPDCFFMRGGKMLPAQGAVGKWYEEHGGHVVYFGKPNSVAFEFALQQTQSDPARTVMVGDMLETDILGGHSAGLKTVLITQTGITGYLLQQGQTLTDIYQRQHVVPDYVKNKFGENILLERFFLMKGVNQYGI